MKLVIADTSSLLSLGHVGQIELINKIFDEFFIAGAVFTASHIYHSYKLITAYFFYKLLVLFYC
jgi:predicted nucleic acid-binding protein